MDDDDDFGYVSVNVEELKIQLLKLSNAPFTDNQELKDLLKDLNLFQELPQLLDPILPEVLPSLLAKLPSAAESTDSKDHAEQLSSVVYAICKIRGYKVIMRFFPSNVGELPRIAALSSLDASGTWQFKYCCLLWLSVLILAPFKLSLFDSSIRDNEGTGLLDQIYASACRHLAAAGKTRDAAAVLVARLVTRPDTRDEYCIRFVQDMETWWTDTTLQTLFAKIGGLQAIAGMIRLLPPNAVRETLGGFLNKHLVIDQDQEDKDQNENSRLLQRDDKNTVLEQLIAKVLGRATVVYIKYRLAEESELENLISTILIRLHHGDTQVRLKSAKALANITAVLPPPQQNDIIETIYRFVTDGVSTTPVPPSDPSSLQYIDEYNTMSLPQWHGSLIFFAELLRLKTSALKVKSELVLTLVQVGAGFEQRKLTHASGSNVRDAACYVAWAFFRAYPSIAPDLFRALVDALVTPACFDRDTNIRRAAAAAVQEGIGRHPDATMGIPVVQALDFFKLGNRESSFVEAAGKLYDLGFETVIGTHAVYRALVSWDWAVAKLAAKSIARISERHSEAKEIFFEKCKYLAVNKNAFVLPQLYFLFGEMKVSARISDIVNLKAVQNLDQEDKILAEGYMHFLADLVVTKKIGLEVELSQLEHILLQKTWTHVDDEIRKIASQLTSLSSKQEKWLSYIDQGIHGFVVFFSIYKSSKLSTIETFDKYTTMIKNPTIGMVDRANGMSCLGEFIEQNPELASHKELKSLLLNGLDDYTVGQQGDIGSWMRTATIFTLWKVIPLCQDIEFWDAVAARLLRISVELLDRLRQDSLALLEKIPTSSSGFSKYFATHHLSVVASDDFNNFFPTMLCITELPDIPPAFAAGVIEGVVCTAGARTASSHILNLSFQALSLHLSKVSSTQLLQWRHLLSLCSPTQPASIMAAALRVLSHLLEAGVPPPSELPIRSLYVALYNTSINVPRNELSTRVVPATRGFAALALLGSQQALARLVYWVKTRKTPEPVRIAAAEALFEVYVELGDEENAEKINQQRFDELDNVIEKE